MSTRHRFVVVLALLGALAVPALGRTAPATYIDPSGDNGAGADIGAVSVELGFDGYLHVEPTIANQPPILTPGALLVGFDSDLDPATGDVGLDFLFFLDFADLNGSLSRWDGSTWVDAPTQQGDVRFIVGGSRFELLIRPSALGGAMKFNFVVAVGMGEPESIQLDLAPDAGRWLFEQKAPLVAETVDAKFVPAAPKAGAVFQPAIVRLKLSDGTYVVAASYRCVATLGGKLLRGTGRGGCTFKLPRNAKGKRLSVTLFVPYGGTTDEYEPYVFKVR